MSSMPATAVSASTDPRSRSVPPIGRSRSSPTGMEANRAAASGHMPALLARLGQQQEEHPEHGAGGQREPDHPGPAALGALRRARG